METLPNIIHISWHDTGRHFGCYGIESVATPGVDALAAEGVLMERAFACAAVCSPSRGACLTGRYPQSNGLMGLAHPPFNWRFREDEKHLARLLAERGYFTTLQGFQHEVPHGEAASLGFHECRNNGPAPPVYPVPAAATIADGALAFLENYDRDEPFYMQLGFFETHRPFDFGGCPPDDSLGVHCPPFLEDTADAREDLAAFQGAIREADRQLGRVLQALEASGRAENTIVAFMPDHGIPYPRAKATLYDPGLSIATVWRWPAGGVSGGRRSGRLVSNVDYVPTLFELAGLEAPANLEGQSYANALGAFTGGAEREAVFAEHVDGHRRCVRTGRYKLILNFTQMRTERFPASLSGGGHPILQRDGTMTNVGPAEFYDLRNDPNETANLAEEETHADAFHHCLALLGQWMREVDDPVPRGALIPPRWHETRALLGRRFP